MKTTQNDEPSPVAEKRRSGKSQTPNTRSTTPPGVQLFLEASATFLDVHQRGNRVIQERDSRTLDNVIAAERDLIHAQRQNHSGTKARA